MSEFQKIGVLGDGGWGTTLAIHLAGKGYSVRLWGVFSEYVQFLNEKRENVKFLPTVKIPQEIFISSDLKEVVVDSDLVVLATPSHFMRALVSRLRDFDLSRSILLSVAKGIENDTLMRMSEVIRDVLGDLKLAVLSGPSIALEVARGLPTAVVVSSQNGQISQAIQQAFMTERFRVYTNPDTIGVELGGSLKNIVAIAVGISDGLGFGTNTKAALLTRGLVEITRLGVSMGARPETFSGLAGMGDLVTTCTSKYSRNRHVGEEIGRGKRLSQILKGMEMVAEGVKTTKSAYQLSLKRDVQMPITKEIYSVLYEDKDPLQAVRDLMTREGREE